MKKLISSLCLLALLSLSARAVDITFAWDANTDAIDEYHFYMGTVLLGVVGASPNPTFTATGLTPSPTGQPYSFCVKAFNVWGESPASNVVIVSGVPPLLTKNLRRVAPVKGAQLLNSH